MLATVLTISLAVLAYVLGSVPFGLVFAKTFCGIDPRTAGSGNVGATNVARLCGFKWGALTLVCDVLKGFLPVLVCRLQLAEQAPYLYLFAAFAAVAGHMFSLFLGFKGGKGVATTVGVFLAAAPVQLVVAGIVCLLVIWRSGYVSAGSLSMMAVLPLLFLFRGAWSLLLLSLVIGGLVVYAHRENIVRLLRGEEKSWMKKKSETS